MIQVKVWHLALGAAMCVLVGFLWGTEWQKRSLLHVEEYELPGLLIDQAVFERALVEEQAKADEDPIAIAHLKSTLVMINADITRARDGR
jgi:D-serine deaminase-like pyridoxal phosphate-dependent protein